MFFTLLGLTLVLMAVLAIGNRSLTNEHAPHGILSFEFAGDVKTAQAMLDAWARAGVRAQAGFSLGFDFLFPLAYGTTFLLACLWAADVLRDRRWPLAAMGVLLAWGQWLAALLDYVENVALAVMLFHGASDPWPQTAFGAAALKFALLGLGFCYALYGVAARVAGGAKAV